MGQETFTIEEIKNIVSEIAERHGVKRIFLFGSYARGNAKSGSDLDFRIDKGQVKGLFALGGLYADLEEAFGLPVDLLVSESLNDEFKKEISSEEILIYEQQ